MEAAALLAKSTHLPLNHDLNHALTLHTGRSYSSFTAQNSGHNHVQTVCSPRPAGAALRTVPQAHGCHLQLPRMV